MPAREIYHDDLFTAPIGKVLLDNRRLRLIVQAGIVKDHIVLGFHPADVRQHTEYAVA